MEKRKLILFLAAIIGIVDTFYLVDRHFNANGACSTDVKEFLGYPIDCGFIDSTEYSEVAGIPLALIGLIYYLAVFSVLYLDNFIDKRLARWIAKSPALTHLDIVVMLSTLGFIYSIYLIYVQFAILKIVCIYCLYSSVATFVIFTTSWSMKFIK